MEESSTSAEREAALAELQRRNREASDLLLRREEELEEARREAAALRGELQASQERARLEGR